jgi:hypothetical protein
METGRSLQVTSTGASKGLLRAAAALQQLPLSATSARCVLNSAGKAVRLGTAAFVLLHKCSTAHCTRQAALICHSR